MLHMIHIMLNIHVALSSYLASLGHFLCVQTLNQTFTREENLCVVRHPAVTRVLQGDTPLHREHIVMYIIIALFPDYYHYAYKILLATCIYKDGLELARHTQTDRSREPKSLRKVHLYIEIYIYICIYVFILYFPDISPESHSSQDDFLARFSPWIRFHLGLCSRPLDRLKIQKRGNEKQ